MDRGTWPGRERSAASNSISFDPHWWPWVFGGAAAVFLVSLIGGYVSGRCQE
jgi:hypothetical protein